MLFKKKPHSKLQFSVNLLLSRPQENFSLHLEFVSAGDLFNGKDEVGGEVDIVPWVTDCMSFFQLLSATDNVLVFFDCHICDSDLNRRTGIIYF